MSYPSFPLFFFLSFSSLLSLPKIVGLDRSVNVEGFKGQKRRKNSGATRYFSYLSPHSEPRFTRKYFLPTFHLHFQSLCSFLKLTGKGAKVVIHKNLIKARRRQTFCHLSFLSTLLAFTMRDKEREHFLPTAGISSLPSVL